MADDDFTVEEAFKVLDQNRFKLDEKTPDGLNIVPFRQTGVIVKPGRMLHTSVDNPAHSRAVVKPVVRIMGGSLPDTINEAEQ